MVGGKFIAVFDPKPHQKVQPKPAFHELFLGRFLIGNRSVTTHRTEVNSRKQPVQLLHRELDDGAVFSWPDKTGIFQSLLQ
jgi:hypothetical protein